MNHPPKAALKPHIHSIHGDDRQDPYYWLRERENAEVIDYLNAENAYTKQILSPTDSLQETLYEEIVGRIKKDEDSVPYEDNGYMYQSRYRSGQEYPIYYRWPVGSTQEEVLLDVNELAKPHSFYNINAVSISPDNQWLIYGEDSVSRRLYTLRFKNLKTGETLETQIPNTASRAIWAADSKTIFYTAKDPETLRPNRIMRHILGTNPTEDVEIFREEDDTFLTYVYQSKSKAFIFIGSFQTVSSEFRYLASDDPMGTFQVFSPRERMHEYEIFHHEDHFYIKTNWEAQNFRLMRTPVSNTDRKVWEEVIPNRTDVLLEEVDVFKQHILLQERKSGISQIQILPFGNDPYYIEFAEKAYMAYPIGKTLYDGHMARIGYQSMTTPPSVFDFDMVEQKLILRKEQEVLGDFDKANYTSERIMIEARDGVNVPVSIVYRKTTEKGDSTPLLQYGYGSYGHSMEPYFSSARLSLLDRGFIFAIAHIRGGEEMGRYWYEDGKLLKKKNTFNDFIDVSKALIKSGYTSPDHLYAMGGSAGGLLMGAVINDQPELYHGVIAAVPFVDVVTTMLDESIPLTTGEFDEWGNPKEETYYHYIKSYSPYDNIKSQAYPHLLVTTGLHDSQVQYWEPAKWVARLRTHKTDQNHLLLHTNMDTGHGGPSGRFAKHKETAMDYAFFIWLEENRS